MICFNPIWVEANAKQLRVGCGRCPGCRVTKAEEWTHRIMWELKNFKTASFVTLTYNEEHMPIDQSVNKRDLQLFFKRLRKELSCTERTVKYFACGEYGEARGRPHYHAIILGLSAVEQGAIERAWRNETGQIGTIKLLPFNKERARYTANYLLKEVNPEINMKGRTRPFILMSKRLGAVFLEDGQNIRRIVGGDGITLNGTRIPVPRYFRKLINAPATTDNQFMTETVIMHLTRYHNSKKVLYNLSGEVVKQQDIHFEIEQRIAESRRQAAKNFAAKNNYKRKRNEPF